MLRSCASSITRSRPVPACELERVASPPAAAAFGAQRFGGSAGSSAAGCGSADCGVDRPGRWRRPCALRHLGRKSVLSCCLLFERRRVLWPGLASGRRRARRIGGLRKLGLALQRGGRWCYAVTWSAKLLRLALLTAGPLSMSSFSCEHNTAWRRGARAPLLSDRVEEDVQVIVASMSHGGMVSCFASE